MVSDAFFRPKQNAAVGLEAVVVVLVHQLTARKTYVVRRVSAAHVSTHVSLTTRKPPLEVAPTDNRSL